MPVNFDTERSYTLEFIIWIFFSNTVELHACDEGIYCTGRKEILRVMDSNLLLYLIRSVLPPCFPTSPRVLAVTELLRVGSTDENLRCLVDYYEYKFKKISQRS